MIKLKRFDEAVWFTYVPGVRLKIKPLSRADSLQIRLKCKQKIAVQGKNGGDSVVDDIDLRQVVFESFRMALVDWEGIEVEGVKAPERNQILTGLFENQGVIDFVMDKAFEMNAAEEGKLQDELKNSESSQAGLPSNSASK